MRALIAIWILCLAATFIGCSDTRPDASVVVAFQDDSGAPEEGVPVIWYRKVGVHHHDSGGREDLATYHSDSTGRVVIPDTVLSEHHYIEVGDSGPVGSFQDSILMIGPFGEPFGEGFEFREISPTNGVYTVVLPGS